MMTMMRLRAASANHHRRHHFDIPNGITLRVLGCIPALVSDRSGERKDQEAFIHCPDLSVNIHAVFKKLFTEVNAVQNYCVLSYGKSTHQVPFLEQHSLALETDVRCPTHGWFKHVREALLRRRIQTS